MLTISLDEQGDFESLHHENQVAPLFIGGVIYDDGDDDAEFTTEKRRINQYLKSVCEQVDAIYPKDLHVNNRGNHAKVRDVKIKLSETLAEFLTRGTYIAGHGETADRLNCMPRRKGKYHIFAIVKSGKGKRELMGNLTSELVREDYASNLYIHMAEDVVERIIFHNPVIDVKHVRLELATRRAVLEGDDCERKAREYIKLGYKEDLDPEHMQQGKRTFLLTNADNYRTAIEREMLSTEKKDISIDQIGVKSIYYGSETQGYRMEFLYLADIICSVLGFKPDISSPQALLRDFKDRADQCTGHSDNLIFAYDAIDTGFKKAWHCLEEKDYFKALRIAYDSMKSNSDFAAYYSRIWFSRLEERIMKETDVAAYEIALKKLFGSTRQNNLRQEELIYIFDHLEKIGENMTFRSEEEKAVLYELYDAGVSAYCHIGDSEMANRYLEKCSDYAKYIGLERYLRTRNKMVVFMCDWFMFEEALELAQENLFFHEELLAMKKLVFGDALELSLDYSIACSQLGQAYSYLHDARAEEAFLMALNGMGDKNSPNYLQTASYLLHHYIDMGEQEKYDELACEYFGGNSNLRKQLRYLITEGSKGQDARFSMKFALYVYIKGLYCFHIDEISEGLLNMLINIEETLRKSGNDALKQLNGHPWEIIYKYIALIALYNGLTEEADRCMEKSISILKYHGLALDMICWFGRTQYAWAKENQQEAARLLETPPDTLGHDTEVYKKLKEMEGSIEKYKYLQNQVITYMYR